MQVFDFEKFRATPLSREPYEHLVVPGFVTDEALQEINADYPKIEHAGSYPLGSLRFGAVFQQMVEALESAEFREAFERKFEIDLSNRPTTITVRGRSDTRDGNIHRDSESKIITVLLYVNPSWDDSGGRLRLLRSRDNINDVATEAPASGGALVAFLRSDHSWHGHLPFIGERRVIQFNWVTDNESQRFAILRHRLSASVKQMFGFGKTSKDPHPAAPEHM
jgi:SM-20-related protein